MAAKCPACGNGAKPENMMRHLRACCPDHLQTPEAAPLAARVEEEQRAEGAAGGGGGGDALCALLEAAARREASQRRRVLRITFMVEEREERERQEREQQHGPAASPASAGLSNSSSTAGPCRRPLPEVARLMVLPERRAARLLERALHTIEMPREPDPSLVVLHECARFLAVAKPPGVPTTPAHRWRGGSMVNRLLWYGERFCGGGGAGGEGQEDGGGGGGGASTSSSSSSCFEPRVLHRLDFDTSGVLLCAKDARAAAAGQAALLAGRSGGGGGGGGRGAEKMYVALAYGWPPPWLPCPPSSSSCSAGSSAFPSPPPGVTVVATGVGREGHEEEGRETLLTFDVDAAIGRHPGSAVGRRVAGDAKPFFAAAAAEAEAQREADVGDGGGVGGGGGGRRGRGRGGGALDNKEAEDEDEDEDAAAAAAAAFLPASTRFVVLAAATEPPPCAESLFPREREGGEGGGDPTAPAPLACEASRAATLATFGPAATAAAAAPDAPGALSRRRRCCLVLASLRTGRTHQIRLHLAHAGLPIAGDELYGCALRPLLPRQALHAWRLRAEVALPPEGGGGDGPEAAAAVRHPPPLLLDLKAPLPDDMLRAARALGVPIPAAVLSS